MEWSTVLDNFTLIMWTEKNSVTSYRKMKQKRPNAVGFFSVFGEGGQVPLVWENTLHNTCMSEDQKTLLFIPEQYHSANCCNYNDVYISTTPKKYFNLHMIFNLWQTYRAQNSPWNYHWLSVLYNELLVLLFVDTLKSCQYVFIIKRSSSEP